VAFVLGLGGLVLLALSGILVLRSEASGPAGGLSGLGSGVGMLGCVLGLAVMTAAVVVAAGGRKSLAAADTDTDRDTAPAGPPPSKLVSLGIPLAIAVAGVCAIIYGVRSFVGSSPPDDPGSPEGMLHGLSSLLRVARTALAWLLGLALVITGGVLANRRRD
jgi:hypothetical protein